MSKKSTVCLLCLFMALAVACEKKGDKKDDATTGAAATGATGGDATSTAAAASAATTAGGDAMASETDAYPIKAGEGIGPVKLGMSKEEVEKAGLEIKPHPSEQLGEEAMRAGGIDFMLKDGKVSMVAITTDVRASHKGEEIDKAIKLEAARELFEGCGEIEVMEGGNQVKCAGKIYLATSSAHPDGPLSISLHESMDNGKEGAEDGAKE